MAAAKVMYARRPTEPINTLIVADKSNNCTIGVNTNLAE